MISKLITEASEVTITANSSESWREIWNYRELVYFLTWRDIKIRYKQTVLGVLWAIIQPLATMLVFTLLFGRIAKIPSNGVPYPVFYLSALLPWTYFSSVLISAGNSLVTNSNLLTKIYFPRIILPASAALAGLVDFFIGSVIMGVVLWFYGFVPGVTSFLWLLLIVPMVFLTLGVGMILSALNVKYRDVKYALPFLIQIWLFVTPVIYPATLIPERFRWVVLLNPLSGLIEGFRASVLPTGQLNLTLLGSSLALTALVFVVGFIYFRNTQRSFADIV